MKTTTPMSFAYFKECMTDVVHDYEYYDKVCDVINSDFMYENLRCAGTVLDILAAIFEDESDWISYYCFELDFGKRYEPGCVKKDGKNVPLATLEDLYNLLLKNYQDRGPLS